MSLSNYKGYSLRNKIFFGFLLVCVLSIVATSAVSYYLLRNSSIQQSATEQQDDSNSVMAALDYAVSNTEVETKDIPNVLQNKIYEIADINKHDLIIYSLKGDYLVSNKEKNQVCQKKIPANIITSVLKKEKISLQEYDPVLKSDRISSYAILKNNTLTPIGIVYFPYYHDESVYKNVLQKYLKYIILINLIVIAISICFIWLVSNNLTRALSLFSAKMDSIDLIGDKNLEPIKYYENDELKPLVKGYNNMILQINSQKDRLSQIERETAWREMAKQVAHEVKNPLTPMKLTIQNFERKFDPEDPQIKDKVKKMVGTVTEHIDLIATVATAFSQFAQLPEKNNEIFNLNEEIAKILQIFNNDQIFLHTNKSNIMINMDRIYLNRIITNLVTNAKQAERPDVNPVINVDIEQFYKRIVISVEDNGTGISEDKLEKIFEPNFTSKSSGMGLGLTMVRKMIEDYKGEIKVQSTLGKGTKFTITMPSNV